MAQLAEQPTETVPRVGKQGEPCVMVIFGAAGDLTGRMLIPALYNLARASLLSREFAVVGVARAAMSDEEFRKKVYEHVKEYCTDCVDSDLWEWFARRFYYFRGDFNDDRFTRSSNNSWTRSTTITRRIRTFFTISQPRRIISDPSSRSWPPPG